MLPLSSYVEFSTAAELGIALLLGLGFGFALERAGFGSARKLTAVFYLYDMAVVKVMFTAIVTALAGLFLLRAGGFMDLSDLYVEPTSYAAQALGGLIFGAGFIVGGYCPGTSLVAAVTGRLDGLVFLLGVTFGILVFGEAYPLVKGFYEAGGMGAVTLPQALHLPYGLVVLLVVLMAIGGFAGASWLERRFAPPREEA